MNKRVFIALQKLQTVVAISLIPLPFIGILLCIFSNIIFLKYLFASLMIPGLVSVFANMFIYILLIRKAVFWGHSNLQSNGVITVKTISRNLKITPYLTWYLVSFLEAQDVIYKDKVNKKHYHFKDGH